MIVHFLVEAGGGGGGAVGAGLTARGGGIRTAGCWPFSMRLSPDVRSSLTSRTPAAAAVALESELRDEVVEPSQGSFGSAHVAGCRTCQQPYGGGVTSSSDRCRERSGGGRWVRWDDPERGTDTPDVGFITSGSVRERAPPYPAGRAFGSAAYAPVEDTAQLRCLRGPRQNNRRPEG